MSIKKIIAAGLTAAMVLSLTACGNDAEDPFANFPQNEQTSGGILNPAENKPTVCPNCGTALIADAQFCYNCGAGVAAPNGLTSTQTSGADLSLLGNDFETSEPEESKPVVQLPDIPVNDATAFEYEYNSELGGMVVTGYSSEDSMVHIPDMLENEKVVGVAFSEVEKDITHIIMPDSVIGFAFSEQIRGTLQFVNIPADMTEIHIDAFSVCTSLTSIDIPESVTEIGRTAFSHCTSLTSINIPDGVTKIGAQAFYGCTSLTSINIPDSVTEIGGEAFKGCTNIQVTYKGETYDYEHLNNLGKVLNRN